MTDWPYTILQDEAWELISTQVLSGAASMITFSSIAATAAPRMRLYLYLLQDGTPGNVDLKFNSDGGANYDVHQMYANDATKTPARVVNQTMFRMTTILTVAANTPAFFVVNITKPTAGEVGRAVAHGTYNAAAVYLQELSAEWDNTGALINRIDVSASAGNFAVGTRAVLEGVAV